MLWLDHALFFRCDDSCCFPRSIQWWKRGFDTADSRSTPCFLLWMEIWLLIGNRESCKEDCATSLCWTSWGICMFLYRWKSKGKLRNILITHENNIMGGTQRSNVGNARGDQLSQIFSVTFQRKHKKQRLPCKISERKLKRRLKETAVGKRENSRPLEQKAYSSTGIQLTYHFLLSFIIKVKGFWNTITYWLVWL